MAFELGVYHFGELTPDPTTGAMMNPGVHLRHLVEQATVADQVGLDVFGVGEHHRTDFAVSAPAVVLAAMAQATDNIKLSSAVTVLSSDDPVRVFQQFATVDLLSEGRAEIIAGRGSYTESFPLFGYDLSQYNELFAEKLDLLLKLRDENPINWEGQLRPPLIDGDVTPRPDRQIPVWIAVGGTPASVVRAAKLGLPLSLAIIGGSYQQFGTVRRSVPQGCSGVRTRSEETGCLDCFARICRYLKANSTRHVVPVLPGRVDAESSSARKRSSHAPQGI